MAHQLRRLEGAGGSTGGDFLDTFAEVSEAVEAGAGLPEVARATSRALDASIVIIDSSSSVLAVACASPADERAVVAGADGSERLDLRVADARVGELRYRTRGTPPQAALMRMVTTLIALEVERSVRPERAAEAAVGSFLGDLLDRRVTDRENIVARGNELGAELADGGSVVVARARPAQPEEGDWRARVLATAERGARAVERSALVALVDVAVGRARRPSSGAAATHRLGQQDNELIVLVPGPDIGLGRRVAEAVHRELDSALVGYAVAVARSRPATDPVDLHRAGAEALLTANVAEAGANQLLAFEEIGSYRLLLPALSEDPAELERFFEETLAPIVAYDDQYETELVHTLESFLDEDGSVAKTAGRLFTHRHTVRYRLERIRELTGLDVSSSDGRERLGLGLKAMSVLGILPPRGPATERGAEAGRVTRDEKDR